MPGDWSHSCRFLGDRKMRLFWDSRGRFRMPQGHLPDAGCFASCAFAARSLHRPLVSSRVMINEDEGPEVGGFLPGARELDGAFAKKRNFLRKKTEKKKEKLTMINYYRYWSQRKEQRQLSKDKCTAVFDFRMFRGVTEPRRENSAPPCAGANRCLPDCGKRGGVNPGTPPSC